MILRSSARKLAALGAALVLPNLAAARFENDFSDYPRAAISCLEEADKNSGCNGDTVIEMNECLCGDGGGFLTNSAKCIGDKSAEDLETAYAVFKINCDNSETPMKYNLAEFLDLAKAPSGSGSASNTGAQPTKTNDPNEEDKGGLSMGAIIGIAVGAGVIAIGAIVAAVLLLRRRKRRNLEEAHPMLVSQGYNPGAGFPPVPGSGDHHHHHAHGMYHSPNDVKAESSNPSSPTWRPTTQSPAPPSRLSPHQQQQAWNNNNNNGVSNNSDPRHASWNSQQSWNGHQSWSSATQPYHALGTQAEQQQHPQQQFGPPVFELPNNPSAHLQHQPPPVEMPASPLNQRQQQQGDGSYDYGRGRY